MSMWARLKSGAGGQKPPTVTAATAIEIDESHNSFYVDGTSTVTTINATKPILEGREVTFYSTAGTPVFGNTDSTSTKGELDLGGSDITLDATDFLVVKQMSNGTWVRKYATSN